MIPLLSPDKEPEEESDGDDDYEAASAKKRRVGTGIRQKDRGRQWPLARAISRLCLKQGQDDLDRGERRADDFHDGLLPR